MSNSLQQLKSNIADQDKKARELNSKLDAMATVHSVCFFFSWIFF